MRPAWRPQHEIPGREAEPNRGGIDPTAFAFDFEEISDGRLVNHDCLATPALRVFRPVLLIAERPLVSKLVQNLPEYLKRADRCLKLRPGFVRTGLARA